MKKLCFSIVTMFLLTIGVQAQGGFNLGVFVGIPVADGADVATFSTGIDVSYLFEINDKFSLGPATGYSHSFGDSVGNSSLDYDDFQYIPIAGAGRFHINEMFTVGVDLGFAVGVNDGNDGGFYFRPLFGYNVTEKIMLTASYRGISLSNKTIYDGTTYYGYGGSFSILSVGASFNL